MHAELSNTLLPKLEPLYLAVLASLAVPIVNGDSLHRVCQRFGRARRKIFERTFKYKKGEPLNSLIYLDRDGHFRANEDKDFGLIKMTNLISLINGSEDDGRCPGGLPKAALIHENARRRTFSEIGRLAESQRSQAATETMEGSFPLPHR